MSVLADPCVTVGVPPAARIFEQGERGAVGAFLPDGRLHLQHGPIDLICAAWGPGAAAGYSRAAARFAGVLDELVAELPALRQPGMPVTGGIARRMAAAVAPFRPVFITPMAAVAGAVAEEVLAALSGPGVVRAYVNNGGDIALCLTGNERLSCAVAGHGAGLVVEARDSVRGIATSGWRGRSWSLGIADAVTVLARTAAMADAAATLIANAVDLPGHPAVTRAPAVSVQADSDLGLRLVTVDVAPLTEDEVREALARGSAVAEEYRQRGLIVAAALFLGGQRVVTGPVALQGDPA